MSDLELWAGVECTINRVQDVFVSQCEKSGHDSRLTDLELFAQLGVKRLRYPFLWERVEGKNDDDGWYWCTQRIKKIRELKLNPIAGLLHHGSGPLFTHLLDPEFPYHFSLFAKRFAERFYWIEDYTPINEPLTTSRFSCLYGIWYPHLRNDKAWARSMYHQILAIRLAMNAIRSHNPGARLIQTEDLGKAQGTSVLQDQVDFENERRWLTWDLLCGRVDKSHPLFNFLLSCDLKEKELLELVESPCPPDMIGINHYPLSNRFLDHELIHYPIGYHGGNGRQIYADVGAVDSGRSSPIPAKEIFREAWDRYQIPIAITEAHSIGHREQQLAWLCKIWESARCLRLEGADIRAITAWSLLGTFDWNSLCTKYELFYEPGIFDIRVPDRSKPRETVLRKAMSAFARGRQFFHPVLDEPPRWESERRILYAPQKNLNSTPSFRKTSRVILITGAGGTLGRAFNRICRERGICCKSLTRSQLDICQQSHVEQLLDEVKPWYVINAAGYVKVDQAEIETELCFRENLHGPLNLAQACFRRHIGYTHFSSDLVFDGKLEQPYTENDRVAPINVYGHSKAKAELAVLSGHPEALLIRTSSFFGPWDKYNFVVSALKSLKNGRELHASGETIISPTYIPDLVNSVLDLIIDGEQGLLHLSNQTSVTWAELARLAAIVFSLDPSLVVERKNSDLPLIALRPKQSALASSRFNAMPSLHTALECFFDDLEMTLEDSHED